MVVDGWESGKGTFEAASVQLCAFPGVEIAVMRIIRKSSAVIMEKNQQQDILTHSPHLCCGSV